MLYSFFLIIMKNVGRSSAFRPRYPNIYYRAKKNRRLQRNAGAGIFFDKTEICTSFISPRGQ